MGIQEQGSKPTGFIGKIVGCLMNRIHSGGGKFIKYLSEINPSYKLFGIDHSIEMTELSKKINRHGIEINQVKISQGTVEEIPIKINELDLVTAFETVQFWPEINKSFSNIFMRLKDGGTFLIMNRYPPEGSKWWKMAKIKNDNEYLSKLKMAGFSNISIDLDNKKGWIIIKAVKKKN